VKDLLLRIVAVQSNFKVYSVRIRDYSLGLALKAVDKIGIAYWEQAYEQTVERIYGFFLMLGTSP
jgi:hypothetical protein